MNIDTNEILQLHVAPTNEVAIDLRKNIKWILYFVSIYVILIFFSVVLIHLVEQWAFLRSLIFTLLSVTTIGYYGPYQPTNTYATIISIFDAVLGGIAIALLISVISISLQRSDRADINTEVDGSNESDRKNYCDKNWIIDRLLESDCKCVRDYGLEIYRQCIDKSLESSEETTNSI